MSPSTQGTARFPSSWIFLAITLFVLQRHSKRNKRVNKTKKMGLAPRPSVGMFGENVMTILVQRFGDLRNMFVQIPLPTSP